MKRIWLEAISGLAILALVAALPAAATAMFHPNRPVVASASSADEEVFLDEILVWDIPIRWVDARSRGEYEKSRVAGAYHLSPDNWNDRSAAFYTSLEPGDRVVIYCGDSDCGASREIANRLKNELGLQDVHVLQSGWAAIEANSDRIPIE